MNIKSKVKIVPKELTKAQLIALIVQAHAAPYAIAMGMSKAALVDAAESILNMEPQDATEQ